MNNIFSEDFRDFISALNASETKYVLVGGMAVMLHGYLRTTGDMDVWIEQTTENYKRLVKAFALFGMPVFDMKEEKFLSKEVDVFSFGRVPVRIDVMTKVKGLDFSETYAAAQIFEENGLPISYIDIHMLLQAKRASGRYKDLDDIEQLSKKL